ncbi:MAG: IS110 family transposase [Terracidiphilus sp.]
MLAEAVQKPTMRFVPIKTEEQLDMQALHRVRDRLVSQRTRIVNQIRAFLLERGIAVSVGRARLENSLPAILEEAENGLSTRMRRLVADLRQEWIHLDTEISQVDREIGQVVAQDENSKHLTTIPGIGPIIATVITASIGNGRMFAKGRDFSAWLGLVPRQYSTGGKSRLLGISKRGNPYIRKLLIQGARAVMSRTARDRHSFGDWLTKLQARTAKNVAAIAMANKLARIAWAVLSSGEIYRHQIVAAV